MTFSALALPNGAIAFRHITPKRPRPACSVLIASGHPGLISRTVLDATERDYGGVARLPGFDPHQPDPDRARLKAAVERLRLDLERRAP